MQDAQNPINELLQFKKILKRGYNREMKFKRHIDSYWHVISEADKSCWNGGILMRNIPQIRVAYFKDLNCWNRRDLILECRTFAANDMPIKEVGKHASCTLTFPVLNVFKMSVMHNQIFI